MIFPLYIINPAGLTFLKGKNIGFTHLEMPDSWTRVEYIGGIINLRLFKKTREVEIRGFKGYKKEKRKQKGLVFIFFHFFF
jgi:hypothetical protein